MLWVPYLDFFLGSSSLLGAFLMYIKCPLDYPGWTYCRFEYNGRQHRRVNNGLADCNL